jgi:hypothetical protein
MLEIAIVKGPRNITVQEGSTAIFPCLITGTTDLPLWYIDGTSYNTFDILPARHMYFSSNMTLVVMDVQLSDNNTAYRCSLFVVSSGIGVLTVVAAQNGKLWAYHCFFS